MRRYLRAVLSHAVFAVGLVAAVANVVALTWERTTAYDDAGLGTLSFLLVYTIGQPFLIARGLITVATGNLLPPALSFVAGEIGGLAIYYVLDRLVISLWQGTPFRLRW